jgi:peptidoglycan/LPS O-acetylase OafA/YrhL
MAPRGTNRKAGHEVSRNTVREQRLARTHVKRDNRAMRSTKVQYLEGLRGIAAVQVVLLHFVTAFLPATAEQAAPPWRPLFDGHTAVYVFFLISGAVLTPSFARDGAWPRQAAKRVVRLGIPVAAAAAIALALLAALPNAHLEAARISGSAWLAMDSSGALTLSHLLREVGLDSLLLGYREYTLFAPISGHLPLLAQSLDAPFWSLHLELYGSLLVLLLVRLQSQSAWLHRATVIFCAAAFGTHPMFLFVLGHICATRLHRPPIALLGTALIVLGLTMSASKDWGTVEAIRVTIARFAPVAAPNLFQFQSQLAAIALFIGALLSPPAQWLLALPPCRQLGRLSFSIYLLHFPILFTLGCAAFVALASTLAYSAAVATAFAGFVLIVLLAAAGFEHFIDRPAIRLSRRLDRVRLMLRSPQTCDGGGQKSGSSCQDASHTGTAAAGSGCPTRKPCA